MSVVQCRAVTKVYQMGETAVHALRGIDLELSTADFASLSGPSGSGKTTLLNIIGGLDLPSSGTVTVDAQRIDSLARAEIASLRLAKIGFVFQAYNLIPVLSAIENIEFVMELQGVPATERHERSKAILERVGLGGMGARRPAELSGGQQQRIAVARAVVAEPKLVLADEPTANLDSATAGALMELMRELNAEKKLTFLFSTHDPIVIDYAKRSIQLHDGQIVQDETRTR